MKKNILFLVILALIAVACSDVDGIVVPDEQTTDAGKELISFSMSDGSDGKTRAGFTGGETFIAMRIQSDHSTTSVKSYTCTTAKATKDLTNAAASYSTVSFQESEKRYWDDAHGRYSKLSVFAVAIPNMATDSKGLVTKMGGVSKTWTSPSSHNIVWEVSTSQTETIVDQEDLAYSNNIKDGGKDGRYKWDASQSKYLPDPTGLLTHYDGQMQFLQLVPDPGPIDTPSGILGKFDKGHLVFNHALSRITVTLTKGDGFTLESPFLFASGTNIKLLGMNVSGTLNLVNGTWGSVTTGDINKMGRKGEGTTAAGTYVAQMLPGYTFTDGSTGRVMEFTIDNNTYYITQDMLYEALKKGAMPSAGSSITMEQGKNYKFTFNVKKRGIVDITATLIPWETVTAADMDLSNARITLNVEDRSGATGASAVTSNMDIYRALDAAPTITDSHVGYAWTTGYTTDNKATWNSNPLAYNSDHWSTDWFWEDNTKYYHIRTLTPTTQAVETNAGVDYTAITSSSCDNESAYSSVAWGAPFKDVEPSYKFIYNTTYGFDGDNPSTSHQIYQAIGPTKDRIKVLMFHMMSAVHFTIMTTDDPDKVQLYNPTGSKRTKVDLVGYYPTGTVLLGTGLVNANGTISTVGSPQNVSCATTSDEQYANQEYFFNAVPQDLENVVLYITAPDNNQYIVDLKDVKATSVTNNNIANPYQLEDGRYTIDSWYPGFKYNYTFTLKKTGIIDLKATVLDWETVTADNEEIVIK